MAYVEKILSEKSTPKCSFFFMSRPLSTHGMTRTKDILRVALVFFFTFLTNKIVVTYMDIALLVYIVIHVEYKINCFNLS